MNTFKVGDVIQQSDIENITGIFNVTNKLYKDAESDVTILLKQYNDLLSLYIDTVTKCKKLLEEETDLNLKHIQIIVSRIKDTLHFLVKSQQSRLEYIK